MRHVFVFKQHDRLAQMGGKRQDGVANGSCLLDVLRRFAGIQAICGNSLTQRALSLISFVQGIGWMPL